MLVLLRIFRIYFLFTNTDSKPEGSASAAAEKSEIAPPLREAPEVLPRTPAGDVCEVLPLSTRIYTPRTVRETPRALFMPTAQFLKDVGARDSQNQAATSPVRVYHCWIYARDLTRSTTMILDRKQRVSESYF